MVCVCEVESVCVCCLQGQGHREVGGWVGVFVSVCVKKIITLAINALALPPSLPSLLVPPLYSFGGESGHRSPAVRGLHESEVLILSQEVFLSSNIRAKSSFSLFFIFPLFFIVHQRSWILATDASPSKQDERYLTFLVHFCPPRLARPEETVNDKLFSPLEQMSQWGNQIVCFVSMWLYSLKMCLLRDGENENSWMLKCE